MLFSIHLGIVFLGKKTHQEAITIKKKALDHPDLSKTLPIKNLIFPALLILMSIVCSFSQLINLSKYDSSEKDIRYYNGTKTYVKYWPSFPTTWFLDHYSCDKIWLLFWSYLMIIYPKPLFSVLLRLFETNTEHCSQC